MIVLIIGSIAWFFAVLLDGMISQDEIKVKGTVYKDDLYIE